ncbi:MAG: ATP phosphoribosyltransferase regulatory subunit, partial [Gammaproteobacteria bacterium]|nr:ATP phosphoribosyltransferase regulatory subunit [Gammaproteobacteria bacterium]
MYNWSLPPHFSDILPNKAWQIEVLRNQWLQMAHSYGYELVIPPMLEFAETLLTLQSPSLEMKSFRIVDPLTGKQLVLRADITNQIARLDGHIFRKEGVTRLCYCGPVVLTYPEDEWGQREALQWGVELLGHDPIEAEVEIIQLALKGLQACGLDKIILQISHTGVLASILAGLALSKDEH